MKNKNALIITVCLSFLLGSAASQISSLFLASTITNSPPSTPASIQRNGSRSAKLHYFTNTRDVTYLGTLISKKRFLLLLPYRVFFEKELRGNNKVYYFLKTKDKIIAIRGLSNNVAENLKRFDGRIIRIKGKKVKNITFAEKGASYSSIKAEEIYIVYPSGKEFLIFLKTPARKILTNVLINIKA